MKAALNIELTEKLDNGIAIYTNNIYTRLRQKSDGKYYFVKYKLNPSKSLDRWKKRFWTNLYLPLWFKAKGISVYHKPDNLGLPILKTCKYVVSLHDIVPYVLREHYFPEEVGFKDYERRLLSTVQKADLIMADSGFTKRDLIEHLGVDEKKIKVVYLGIDENIKRVPDEKLSTVKDKLNIKVKYVLGIGGNEYRKNCISLVRAFEEGKREGRLEACKLVIIGKNAGSNAQINENEDIILTGRVSEEELLALYSGAEVFVYPSLYEGFGLPPLEAMACETAVITSNTTSIPEVVGDAAILVNPLNIADLKEAICSVVSDEKLRNELIARGRERVKLFNWDRTVEEIEKIYKTLK